jgi:hypothetical protein
MLPRLERPFDRFVPLDRSDAVAVDEDLKSTSPELNAGTLPRQPERC